MNKVIKIGFVLALTVMFSGCSSLGTFNKPQLYSGTIHNVKGCGRDGLRGATCNIFTMPIDFVLDTVFIPYKLILIVADDSNSTE